MNGCLDDLPFGSIDLDEIRLGLKPCQQPLAARIQEGFQPSGVSSCYQLGIEVRSRAPRQTTRDRDDCCVPFILEFAFAKLEQCVLLVAGWRTARLKNFGDRTGILNDFKVKTTRGAG